MTAWSFLRSWPLFAALWLAGCATPKPILELAGQGAATVSLAEASLRDYVALTHSQLSARLDLLRLAKEQDARDRATREFDTAIDRRVDIPARNEAADLIRGLGNESRQIRERAAQELEKIAQDANLEIAAQEQVPRQKLAAARKGFELLAQELSPEEWLAFAAGYAKEIQAGVKKLQTSLNEGKSGN